MRFFDAQNIGHTLTTIGLAINAIALIFVWKQLRQSYRLERASFANTLNNEFNQFVEIRVFLKTFTTTSKLSDISPEIYERTLDYLTAFENIQWMINLKVLTVVEAREYFGNRFYEAFESAFFQSKCETDATFKEMYWILFEMHENFEKLH